MGNGASVHGAHTDRPRARPRRETAPSVETPAFRSWPRLANSDDEQPGSRAGRGAAHGGGYPAAGDRRRDGSDSSTASGRGVAVGRHGGEVRRRKRLSSGELQGSSHRSPPLGFDGASGRSSDSSSRAGRGQPPSHRKVSSVDKEWAAGGKPGLARVHGHGPTAGRAGSRRQRARVTGGSSRGGSNRAVVRTVHDEYDMGEEIGRGTCCWAGLAPCSVGRQVVTAGLLPVWCRQVCGGASCHAQAIAQGLRG